MEDGVKQYNKFGHFSDFMILNPSAQVAFDFFSFKLSYS